MSDKSDNDEKWKINKYDVLKANYDKLLFYHVSRAFEIDYYKCKICGIFEKKRDDMIDRAAQGKNYSKCNKCPNMICDDCCRHNGTCLSCT